MRNASFSFAAIATLLAKLVVACLVIIPVVILGPSLWYFFMKNSTNHSGFDFMAFMKPLALAALASLFFLKKVRLARIALVLNLLGVLFFYVTDHFNVMVQYDKWCKRGMPVKYQTTQIYKK